MTRVEKLRAARGGAHVAFAEYLKVRSTGLPVLVFEGKLCPAFYINKIVLVLGTLDHRQVIARGKRNVLELRDLIRRNLATAKDVVLFFVDKDYDREPTSGEFDDVYVTPGYSIENECVRWSVVEAYIRANFDVADADDEAAIASIRTMYESGWNTYVRESKDLHKAVFICRYASTRCLPGDDLGAYFRVNWEEGTVSATFGTQNELLERLQIGETDRSTVIAQLANALAFDSLDALREWRGKFHLSFVRSLLSHVAQRRIGGLAPFKRAARIGVDPKHPSLLAMMSAYVQVPECLERFIRAGFAHRSAAP
ncbi:DUF4435 domain-containing protein [Ottowia testudinis]|uniref:DUF4435 domain-containing protein n=1 Tax=Ottowia testudinis TaxID=2816950 RepID=A0A975H3H4_9BURK|nr:DUF4435 domain-containing protein [Ottowia testudinis]QTD45829.1 DUF4435 domain-containing protein [Ottowia testudinis]